ncbi:carbon-monoxide dehydrogenase large subunit [Solirubrobacter pauli]|uniref:Carbon-monoxide dehydrogenase large subunit n=1 Tax=Solirubrobacter pauli TaxID=166793 RepID=A0A660LC22_9ACTN|nr:xanthine dehydrogenase family protein molybdopterin-binding subunit [Solirubrobacter pauli]RKQ92588.1 carbon-monoxide dehydrogenase large subunit [Solirubrobacter pauli]
MGVASTLGQPVRRREDARLLAGRGRFLDDLPMPDALHMAFVRSPHPFARFQPKRPGRLTFTAESLAGRASPAQIVPPPGLDAAPVPHPLLAAGEVRYVGQPVAAVLAESRALAEDAVDAVEVAYEPLPAVDDPRAGETLVRWEKSAGDVAGAFARAAHVVRTEHVLPRLVAAPPEPRGALATVEGGQLTVWLSSESAHRARAQLAQILRRAEDSIRVVVPDVGGGFSSKGTLPVEAAVAAFAAVELGRPVRWTEDRRENALSAPQGRGVRAAVELALDADGRILALRGRVLADLGAYLLPSTAIPPHTVAMSLTGAYAVDAVEVIVTGARTHRVPTAPFRGAGRAEASFLIETAVDAAARQLRMDRIELRRRNLVRTFPHTTALGWTYDSGDYEACLDRALALVGAADGELVGVGVALWVARSGGLYETASVQRAGDDVVVTVGSTPSGQGHETVFAQLAAATLGVDPERVTVRTGDTAWLADGVGSFTARSTAMGGSAVVAAAQDLLAGGDGHARFASDQTFTSGAYAAVVEVVRATGEVRVRKLVAVDDAGRIVNPLLARGQVVGGLVQALGATVLDALPTAAEVPELVTASVESPSPLNPLGAKGISESGAIGAPAAIANAVADAIGRHLDPPYTPAAVWQALR